MEKIIKKLEELLPLHLVAKLNIVTSFTESDSSKLVVAMAVSKICSDYHGTREEEEKVSKLLVELLKIVFKD